MQVNMKKILYILLLLPLFARAQDEKPPSAPINVFNTFYVTSDGQLWIYKGPAKGWNRMARYSDLLVAGTGSANVRTNAQQDSATAANYFNKTQSNARYQPIENQRLSTGNDVVFNTVKSSGYLYGKLGVYVGSDAYNGINSNYNSGSLSFRVSGVDNKMVLTQDGRLLLNTVDNGTDLLQVGGTFSAKNYNFKPLSLADQRNGVARTYNAMLDTSNANQYVATLPQSIGKRVVLLGSSSIGDYVSSAGGTIIAPSGGMGYNVIKLLTAQGFQGINQGIGGATTASSLSRFFSDVKNLKPDYVIEGTSQHNDYANGGTTESYINNRYTAGKEAQRLGTTVQLYSPFPDDSSTPVLYAQAKDVREDLSNKGFPVVDVLSTSDELNNGKFKAGLSNDGVHGNALQQQYNYQPAYDVTQLSVLHPIEIQRKSNQAMGWKLTIPPATGAPMAMPIDQPLYNWTVSLWVKGSSALTNTTNGTVASTLVHFTSTTGNIMRLKLSPLVVGGPCYANFALDATVIQVTDANIPLLAPNDNEYVHYTLTCKHISGGQQFRLYANGVFQSQLNSTGTPIGVTAFNFMGRPDGTFPFTNGYITRPTVYRSTLTDDDVKRVYYGDVPSYGLILYSRLQTAPGYYLPNDNETGLKGTVSMGAFALDGPVLSGGLSLPGSTKVPTATPGTNTLQPASTAFVQAAITPNNFRNNAATFTLPLTNLTNYGTFYGTTATWTLGTVAAGSNVTYYIKNAGSGVLTINSAAGGNDIYYTSAVATISIAAGNAIIIHNDGVNWQVE